MEERPDIYFSASIQGSPTDDVYKEDRKTIYLPIIDLLEPYGNVINAKAFKVDLNSPKDEVQDKKKVHDDCMQKVLQSDILVAEVTQPSLGVGYEIGIAKLKEKKILCIYRPQSGKSLSAMIRGANNLKTFIVKDYKDVATDVPNILREFFQ